MFNKRFSFFSLSLKLGFFVNFDLRLLRFLDCNIVSDRDIDTAYSMLLNDESQCEAQLSAPSFSVESTSFSAGVQRPYAGLSPAGMQNTYSQKVNFDTKKTNMVCRYCKKPGHTIEKCYKLIGYPNNPQPNRFKKTAAYAHVSESQNMGQAENFVADNRVEQPESKSHGFTKEQYKHLLNLFQQTKVTTQDNTAAGSANFAGVYLVM
ncbi:hypothetical protein A4A49_15664 [Nicotiana attenuata]|uniref:Uncharacterized protein n=1 Tax=Nicotiana attenuata TaxID=49451 RepID=A0A314LEM0_NICAT|nr:hypothetical protein A4A49_15664 [Nicotiana attenuata]